MQWCPPCRMIHPVIEEQAEKHQGITFLRLDIDNSDVLPVVTEHGVSAVPTFVSYQGRQKVAQFSGADKALLMQMVNEVAPQ